MALRMNVVVLKLGLLRLFALNTWAISDGILMLVFNAALLFLVFMPGWYGRIVPHCKRDRLFSAVAQPAINPLASDSLP